MSIRITLDNPPEFYTNLDQVRGHVILHLSRAETVGTVVVKLEGEAKTALIQPDNAEHYGRGRGRGRGGVLLAGVGGSGNFVTENHKILYKVAQVFPDDKLLASSGQNPAGGGSGFILAAGMHEFPFTFKLPFNNACSDPVAMSRIGGLGGVGGFGFGGIRVMDGSKQLFLQHVTATLPPSFTGFPHMAEVRYYIKVTIQRPGFLKENWRYQLGFKFLPIEAPRPGAALPRGSGDAAASAPTGQEAYARRPFVFQPRGAGPSPLTSRASFAGAPKKKDGGRGMSSLFGSSSTNGKGTDEKSSAALDSAADLPPEIEMSARLPHPPILTCNKPIPLRLIATKKMPSTGHVYLNSLEIALIGTTHVRVHDLNHGELSRWVVVTRSGLSVPVTAGDGSAEAGLGEEVVLPDDLWRDMPLPSSVTPSFATCNLGRTYELDIRIGLCWGKPPPAPRSSSSSSFFGGKSSAASQGGDDKSSFVILPLHFSKVQVYSGIAPPPALLSLMAQQAGRPSAMTLELPPRLPARPTQSSPAVPTQAGHGRGAAGFPGAAAARPSSRPPQQQQQQQDPPAHDPLYPPQLGTAAASSFDDAPPSYDEAMADNLSGPFDGIQPRPAYSGVTNENAPSQIPEKN